MTSYLTLLPLCEVFAMDALFLCYYKRGPDRRPRDYFADDTTIFLRYIESLTRTQTILKLYEKASRSKINLSNSQVLWAGGCKNRYNKPKIWNVQTFLLKYLV